MYLLPERTCRGYSWSDLNCPGGKTYNVQSGCNRENFGVCVWGGGGGGMRLFAELPVLPNHLTKSTFPSPTCSSLSFSNTQTDKSQNSTLINYLLLLNSKILGAQVGGGGWEGDPRTTSPPPPPPPNNNV